MEEKEERFVNLLIPEKALQELDIDHKTSLELKVEDQRLMIQSKQMKEPNQTVSLRWFLTPTLITSVLFFIYSLILGEKQIPLTGTTSISNMVIILGLLSGMGSFIAFFVQNKKNQKNHAIKNIYWRNFPTILISFTIILGFALLLIFWMASILFKGASFDRYTATAIFFILSGIVNYLMIFFALSVSPFMITSLLITVIVSGVIFSMITNSDLKWWQINLSFLGTSEAVFGWQFNFTLIISALLMVALIDFLFVTLQSSMPKNKRLIILRILLTLTAIDLGMVGVFPNNGTGRLHELHDQAANFLVDLVIILVIGIRWLLPKVTKEFLGISYGTAVFLLIANTLFQHVGYLSLTAFELIAFILAFSWILLLLQHIERLTHDENRFLK